MIFHSKNINIIIIISLIAILFITVSSISAAENSSTEVNWNGVVLKESSDEIAYTNDSASDTGNNNMHEAVYLSTHGQCSPATQEFSSGNIVYKVSLYDFVNYDGVTYKQPKYGQKVNLKVYTGSSYKNYYGSVGNDGRASVNIRNLGIGNHKVEVYYGNDLKATSSIKVIKSTAKVYAPVKTIKYNKNTYYKIKALDSHRNPITNVMLKVKVFTGKKYRTYSIKTTSRGIAKFETGGLSLGNHIITIESADKKYKIFKSTKIIIRNTVAKKAEKLIVSAPDENVMYKNSHYYKIAVKDGYTDPVKQLVLKVKVYTGKKYKIYSVKTDSKGVAKLQTKNLEKGTHRISMTSANKNYEVLKSSKINVKDSMVYNDGLTRLKSLNYHPDGENYKALLTWYSKPGASYQVLKKTGQDYEVISVVQSRGNTASYYDTVNKSNRATYSVREIRTGKVIGAYDAAGLTLMDSPNVKVDFQNLKATITWSKISDATKYRVFRKMGNDGNYKCIAIVDGKQTSYTDWYYKSSDELSAIMTSDKFVEASKNNLFYTVRACNIRDVGDVEKVSYGLYLKDGDFNLESPAIISLKDNKITWGNVPNAEGYIILKRSNNSSVWEEIGQSKASSSTKISLKIGEIDNESYYSVQAFANKNGAKVFSDFDKGFSLKYYSQNNSYYKVLFIGDSITFGSPYYSSSQIHIFSMPYRISQLTGCVYYNPSIPGSTYHDSNAKSYEKDYRYRIIRDLVDPISVGKLPKDSEHLDSAKNSEGETNTKISDYNVVMLMAGTNDYLDNTPLGSIDDTSTHTFNGALNYILGKIKEASDVRVAKGQDPIKVVFVDLFYSDRTNNYIQLTNRDITPNKIGLTLKDYQKALDKQLNKWSRSFETFHFKTRDYNIVNHANCPYTTADNLHFTKFTYGQYGNAMAEFLAKNVFK